MHVVPSKLLVFTLVPLTIPDSFGKIYQVLVYIMISVLNHLYLVLKFKTTVLRTLV